MPRRAIEQLSEAVANQIAAGEVVERPASAVKELVENAVDADAQRVVVEVHEGGTQRIVVSDDGHGMAPADAERALLRHATSKIRATEDLDHVASFGFRGEALPSIASVSRFVLTTRTEDDDMATRLVVEGGHVERPSRVGAPVGTRIEVDDLFYNVPARQKFLKRAQTELSHVSDALVRLALARPQVAFRLSTEHKELLDIPKHSPDDPRGRLGRILGTQTAAKMHPLHALESGPVRISGWFAEPGLSERGTKGVYTFVNRRFVRDRTVQHAVQDAYRKLLERGRYPVVVLMMELEAGSFDVNVHPQKTEVRFHKSGEVHRAVSRVLGQSLAQQPWRGGASKGVRYQLDGGRRSFQPNQSPAHSSMGTAEKQVARYAPHLGRMDFADNAGAGPTAGGMMDRGPPSEFRREFQSPRREEGDVTPIASEQLEAKLQGQFSSLSFVGQVMGTYLVCQGPGRMVIIDQHAAHERVVFQRLRAQKKQSKLQTQALLVPLTVELDPGRSQRAADQQQRLTDLGFDVEPFGGTTWAIKSCPAALEGSPLEEVFKHLLDELDELDTSRAVEEQIDALFSCAACHSAIRAHDRLTAPEVHTLLADMDEIDFGAYCPHGRPVFVQWSQFELEKLFHRR